MGDLYLDLIVSNIQNMDRQKEVSFFVDTGASRAWISKNIADELGIQPIGDVELELADGSITTYPYGACFFTFGSETIVGNIVIGPDNCEPLVGTHVLQDFRLVLDLEHHTISRSRAMRAK